MEIEYGLKQVEDSRVYMFSIPIILLLLRIVVFVLLVIFLIKKIKE